MRTGGGGFGHGVNVPVQGVEHHLNLGHHRMTPGAELIGRYSFQPYGAPRYKKLTGDNKEKNYRGKILKGVIPMI
jgi:hypothetical protein